MGKPAIIDLEAFDAAVFDLDGVITHTASLHAAAWKELFDDYLQKRATRTGEPFEPFDLNKDYLQYVDGKPRYEGIRSFLESRNIVLDFGNPDDPPDRETICGLGNRKNELFNARLAREGVEVFESSVRFVRELRENGIRIGLVSSSKNTRTILERAGLEELFDVRVDGLDAERLSLKGKPHPDIFLEAARLLEVTPARAFGVEDAISGVQALRSAGYGLVIAVDRGDQAEALRAHGAAIVVRDLAELQIEVPRASVQLPNALEEFEELTRQLESRRLAIFLDYDGTLTPIVSKPELATLSDDMRQVLKDIAGVCTVAIVSGRDRTVVERFVGLDELIYAGSHGFDIAGPNGLRKEHERAREYLPALDEAQSRLEAALARIPGVLIERKRFAIAVHYRLVSPDHLGTVEQAVEAAISEVRPELRKAGGKKVFSIRPKLDWDKGRAVLWLLSKLDLDRPDALPVYIGDDETDEDAFTALRYHGGIGILVSRAPRPTAARYVLQSPAEVGEFLRKLTLWLKSAEG